MIILGLNPRWRYDHGTLSLGGQPVATIAYDVEAGRFVGRSTDGAVRIDAETLAEVAGPMAARLGELAQAAHAEARRDNAWATASPECGDMAWARAGATFAPEGE